VDWGHTIPEIGIEYFPRQVEAEKSANVARHKTGALYTMPWSCASLPTLPRRCKWTDQRRLRLRLDVGEMMKAGERGWNMKRAVNNRLGLTAANDKLPRPCSNRFPTGGTEGFVPDIQGMLSAYYAARGWDEKTVTHQGKTSSTWPRGCRQRFVGIISGRLLLGKNHKQPARNTILAGC